MIAHALAGPGVLPSGSAAVSPLQQACGSTEPGIACRLVWDLSHSLRAAQVTEAYLAGPAQAILRIAFVLLLALILRAAAHRLIGRIAARAGQSPDGESERTRLLFRERRQQRAQALDSVLRNGVTVTIMGIAFVIILGDLGLNIAPVLASAGVLGVAIGFGAQDLVRDFLAGIFMLLEDQYGIGDLVAIANVTGTVEGVSLRITRVRDLRGVVWYVRNGTITQAGNESQGWARAVVDFPVAYDHDIARVRGLMLDAASAMWREPSWREVILEPPEVWGAQELSADQVVIRVTARTVPMRQADAERELRERLKRALEPTAR